MCLIEVQPYYDKLSDLYDKFMQRAPDDDPEDRTFLNVAVGIVNAQIALDDQPKVDAVPVIRCAKCRHWNPDLLSSPDAGICAKTNRQTWDYDFCSQAARRESHGN